MTESTNPDEVGRKIMEILQRLAGTPGATACTQCGHPITTGDERCIMCEGEDDA